MLISTHACHPSLCNDNLSGVAVATFLARTVAALPRRLSYRFVFVPGTIGAIAWLHENQARVDRVKHGLVLACVGDRGPVTYKRSRRGDAAGRPGGRARPPPLRATTTGRRLLAQRLRRAPVLLAGLRPSRRRVHAHAAGAVPRVPHARPTTSTSSTPRASPTRSGSDHGAGRPRRRCDIREPEPVCASRNSASGACTASRGGRKDESLDELALLWVLNLSDWTPHAARHRRALRPRVRLRPPCGGRARRVRAAEGGRMRVVVTGSEGYIGSVLCPYLVERGHDVVGVDSGFYRAPLLYEERRRRSRRGTRTSAELEAGTSTARTRSCTWPSSPTTPSGSSRRTSLRDQPPRLPPPRRGCEGRRRPRFVYTSSCSVYGASDRSSSTRSRRSARRRRMRSARSSSSATSR